MSSTGKFAVIGNDVGLLAYRQQASSKWVAAALVANGECDPSNFSLDSQG
jgi:hypothetical protein